MNRSSRPAKVNIMGKTYTISYMDKPSDVDLYGRKSLWGEIDYWTQSIRIYDRDGLNDNVWHTILHEVAHGIVTELKLKTLDPEDSKAHDDMDLLMLGLVDTLTRNGWW